jgi:hypothetical protein
LRPFFKGVLDKCHGFATFFRHIDLIDWWGC